MLTPHVIRTVEDYREFSTAERDRLGLVSPQVLHDPLLQNLRVPEDEVFVPERELRPAPVGQELQDALEPKADEYGPARRPVEPSEPVNPDSYDVPVSVKSTKRE